MEKPARQLPFIVGIAVFLVALAVGKYLVTLEQDRDQQALRLQHHASISLVRAKLETEINSTMFLALGLSSFVTASPDFTSNQFEQMASMLMRLRPTIRNIGLAPDNVIRHIYPLEGNREALGLRYLEHPIQSTAVLRIMAEKQPVIAGPFSLVQGGEGLINRIPIYPTNSQGQTYYWGLASVVVDPEPIYANAGLENPQFHFALRGKDAKGAQGELFHGEASLFDDPHAVIMDVIVPGGSWQLAGRPTTVSSEQAVATIFFVLIPWLFALLCGLMAYLVTRANLKVRALALHDPLTGIPNRRYLKQMAERQIAQSRRSGRPFSVLHLDIDDFKLVNDRYGHKAGDKGLVFAARQAQKTLRSADFIARVGGDEFIVLLSDTGSEDLLHALIDRLLASMCSPFDYDGMSLSLHISVGWATFPDEGQELDQLIKNADMKMYDLKRTGKKAGENPESKDRNISLHLSG
ncbi:hypothetical protein A7E78_11350 [Syntrophotalea acetylenivorans]|uniref:Diguanylate cyclase n=1 Tax=Syntrophotalea acetylenivorans TaxID=1842532 RepID=A0A1L3GR53_9BACT|nr:diguanylate cyclase [Syntrophotalea acetylenivorans]APG28393.1 hypothetical protein A7E78_11350 [Syntrophotalea acetylenivorans]